MLGRLDEKGLITMQTTQSLTGKIAIVTGAGSGIGRGIAIALAQEGVAVVACGRRKRPLEDTIQSVLQSGGRGVAVPADVSKEEDVQRLVQAALDAFGTLDILINNAGIYAGSHFNKLAVDEWDQVMATNLRGPFLMTRAMLPVFREKRSGHIINISSESGLNYYEADTAYGITKHALNDLGEYIQRENQELNIRVNTICPGMVVSEMTEDDTELNRAKCLYPEDIADLVVWLLTRRTNVKIGTPILFQTMENPWT
jgi:NAD(P)-dependent dehydrogenase (short-subunit alcohol dehydrogenase family)